MSPISVGWRTRRRPGAGALPKRQPDAKFVCCGPCRRFDADAGVVGFGFRKGRSWAVLAGTCVRGAANRHRARSDHMVASMLAGLSGRREATALEPVGETI